MRSKTILLIAVAAPLFAAAPELAPVTSKPASRVIDLPAELLPFQMVDLRARVPGYIEHVNVDRGSIVNEGDVLIELSAPEMKARIAEAESKVQAAESGRVQAEAQLAAVRSTADRLTEAAKTPGAVAGNEVVQAQKQADAAAALVEARKQEISAAQAALKSEHDLEAYLTIRAPFGGVVTDRLVHPGALAGPAGDPLLILQQTARLRLVVPVPEEDLGGITTGAIVSFRVPAFPDRAYSGKVARLAHSLDAKTRAMNVELDVANADGTLAPGMFPSVKWPVRQAQSSLWVPATAVVRTTERTFVIRADNGRAHWVDVRKGINDGDLTQVSGDLHPGDKVVRRATDEMREGTDLTAK
jgi:RND family efflux transporter MFP subunit